MTAKQKANRERFKKAIAEAAKIRAKNPKLTQAEAVKKAWAIIYTNKKTVSGYVKTLRSGNKTDVLYTRQIKSKKEKPKQGLLFGTHKDTKSHNVNIRVVSGLNEEFFDVSVINDIDELRKQYYRLAKKYHPDAGGTDEQMKRLNAEHERLHKKLLAGSKLTDEQKQNEINLDEAIKAIIDAIIQIEGIEIEVIGKWLWVGSITFQFKTPTYDALKKSGLTYIKKAGRPYMVYKGTETKSRGTMTKADIEKKYGKTTVQPQKRGRITGTEKINKTKLIAAIKKAQKALDKRPVI
jgi:hypothetical protein